MPKVNGEREEQGQARQLTSRPAVELAAVGLRVWLMGLSTAVGRYVTSTAPHSATQLSFHDVLNRFRCVGMRVAELLERKGSQVMTPVAFVRLLEDAEALELSARSAEEALPHPPGRTSEQVAAGVVCQMAQGLPFQLRVYAQAAGGLVH